MNRDIFGSFLVLPYTFSPTDCVLCFRSRWPPFLSWKPLVVVASVVFGSKLGAFWLSRYFSVPFKDARIDARKGRRLRLRRSGGRRSAHSASGVHLAAPSTSFAFLRLLAFSRSSVSSGPLGMGCLVPFLLSWHFST